ncbi:MAG: FCD domain-containing protein [Sphingorhabdus sp.]
MKTKAKMHFKSLETTTAPQDIAQEDAASFDVYRQLRSDILRCELKPDERLRFDGLRTTYQAGVGTLREALSHLVSDGLVRIEVGRGFRVAPVSLSDLKDITEWRVEFEVRAVTASMRNGDDAWEAEMVTAFHLISKTGLPEQDASSLEWYAYAEKHSRFHDSMAAACGSPWLYHFRSALLSQAERYQALAVRLSDSLVYRSDDEHRAMMDAVLARDEKLAAKLIENHIRGTATVVVEELSQSGLSATGLPTSDA